MLKNVIFTNRTRYVRKFVKLASSPKLISGVKIVLAGLALLQAIDSFNDASRKIGFKK